MPRESILFWIIFDASIFDQDQRVSPDQRSKHPFTTRSSWNQWRCHQVQFHHLSDCHERFGWFLWSVDIKGNRRTNTTVISLLSSSVLCFNIHVSVDDVTAVWRAPWCCSRTSGQSGMYWLSRGAFLQHETTWSRRIQCHEAVTLPPFDLFLLRYHCYSTSFRSQQPYGLNGRGKQALDLLEHGHWGDMDT